MEDNNGQTYVPKKSRNERSLVILNTALQVNTSNSNRILRPPITQTNRFEKVSSHNPVQFIINTKTNLSAHPSTESGFSELA